MTKICINQEFVSFPENDPTTVTVELGKPEKRQKKKPPPKKKEKKENLKFVNPEFCCFFSENKGLPWVVGKTSKPCHPF